MGKLVVKWKIYLRKVREATQREIESRRNIPGPSQMLLNDGYVRDVG